MNINIIKLIGYSIRYCFFVIGLISTSQLTFANTVLCTDDPNLISNIVSYDLTPGNSYCELCGIGQVRLVISNPTHEDMTDFTITHDFQLSNLEYINGTTRINGTLSANNPQISGTTLEWGAIDFPELSAINGTSIVDHNFNEVVITFQLRSIATTEENLLTANRNVIASAAFKFCPSTTNVDGLVSSAESTLPLREPVPSVTKLGRNTDANQDATSYTDIVYGNLNDDVIWRVEITNDGLAAIQDLKFNDLMDNGNFNINYACQSELTATNLTDANGVGPIAGCTDTNISNSITDFLVDAPFGETGLSVDGYEIDVLAQDSIFIYLVGKVTSSCDTTTRINTASNIEWGCEADTDTATGGIIQTSTNANAGSSTASLSSWADFDGLLVTRDFTGANGALPVGTKGLMTITLDNQTGGSVKNIKLTDVLPAEYVMDPTFTPTIAVTPAYGVYDGMVDQVSWVNAEPNTFPLTSVDPLEPMANTSPQFDLISSVPHPFYSDGDDDDQINMLRNGDVAVIRFRVIMVESTFFDNNANIDTPEENTADTTDPTNSSTTLSNSLTVTFNDFCSFTTSESSSLSPYVEDFTSNPEDLDIDIVGSAGTLILTNDPAQALPVRITLTNNGGQIADDYFVYVTFGTTMEVVGPANCTEHTPPLPGSPSILEVWETPADIPASATVFACSSADFGAIASTDSIDFDFQVTKTTDFARLTEDDLSLRADVVGEITLNDGTLLWFPAVDTATITNRSNNYSLDSVRARVIGFNLEKNVLGNCSENIAAALTPDSEVQIGEECTVQINTGGWFGFLTPGFTYIAVQNIQVIDELPDGQAYISSSDPVPTSSGQIKSIILNPGELAALDEGFFNWQFNQNPVTERITLKDEWFRVNTTTRILNKPIDNSIAPNVHAAQSRNVLNSTFEAVFFNTVLAAEEVFTLDQNAIGFPREIVRRVDLTVIEPNIQVTKEVCNESLYGIGIACTNFVTLADDGDTEDEYIYRITLFNQATDIVSGVDYAPAYNVTVTDVLDDSDLMRVVPFADDNLDNDGDTFEDALDVISEGSISNNIIDDSNPAQITFSHTHSSALEKINPNSSVMLYYRIDPDDNVAPLQILNNSVTISYDSLAGDSGNQTVVQSGNSELGGGRVYNSSPVTADTQILPLAAQPKMISQLSSTAISGSQPQNVSIGEEIEYQLSTLIPVANLKSFIIRDELPDGIDCIEAPAINLDLPPYDVAGFTPGGEFTPSCTGNLVEWNFGDQRLTSATDTNLFNFTASFIARVNNTVAVNNGDLIRNGSTFTNAYTTYINEIGTQVISNFSNFDLIITEPDIVLTKSYDSINNDASDVITVTVTATNTGNASAYNLRVLDNLTLVANLSFLNNVAGTDPPGTVDVSLGANQPIFSWTNTDPKFSLDPTQSISFTYQIRVDSDVQPHEILNSAIEASWTSLPGQDTALNTSGLIGANGAKTGMRIGTLPNTNNTRNDYETTASAFSTVPALSIIKTDVNPTLNAEIGAHKLFQLRISLPEGITNNLLINDQLDRSGLSYVLSNNSDFDISYNFVGISSINGLPPSEASLNSIPADNDSDNIIWDIGTVVTESENDLASTLINPAITVNYYTRINNDIDTNNGSTLQNYVDTSYSNGELATTENIIDLTAFISVTEAQLNVTKVATLISTAPITGGDIIEYVVTITNTGNATAYDLNIVDKLPPELQHEATPVTALINGTAVLNFKSVPFTSVAGELVWGRDNTDETLDLTSGSTLVLTYRVLTNSLTESNTNLINSVQVDWTSLDGSSSYERTGSECPLITLPDDYCATPATEIITIADVNTLTKTIVSDSYAPENDATVRVGDTVTYRLSLNLQEGTTKSITVQDVLPVGMAFVDIVSINEDTVANYTAPLNGIGSNFSYSAINTTALPVAGATNNITFTIGDVVNNPLGDQTIDNLTIIYRARVVEDVLVHQATLILDNTATLSYLDGNNTAIVNPARLESSSTVTVLQPVMTIPTKSDRSGRVSPFNVTVATDIMNFSLSSCNTTGLAPAYNLQLSDTLATQLDEASIAGPINGSLQPDVRINGVPAVVSVDYNYTAPVNRGGVMLFELLTAVNPGECVEVDYDIGFNTDFSANENWNNSVNVDSYWSLDSELGQLYLPLGPTEFTMMNNAPFDPPVKTLLSPLNGEASIGDIVTYQITLPASNAARYEVVITDTLNASLEYVTATEISTNTLVFTDNSVAPGDLSFMFDIVPAGQDVILNVQAKVANNVQANSGVSFNNTASYEHINALTSATILGGASTTVNPVEIVEPLITAAKSVTNLSNPGALPRAGDTLQYSLTLTASGAGVGDNFSAAFDISVFDQMTMGVAYLQGSSAVTGIENTITNPTLLGDGLAIAQTLNWNLTDDTADIDIAEGDSVVVTYNVLVLDSVLPNQSLINNVTVRWTSVDGINIGERNGSNTPIVNDYFDLVSSTIVTGDYTSFVKSKLSDTYNSADDNVRIGDIIQYEIRLGMQEGTLNNVEVIDTLPQGMVFERIISINGDNASPFSSNAPFLFSDVSAVTVGDALIEPTLVTFSFGNIVNSFDNDSLNDELILTYSARVLDKAHAQINNISLTNNAQLNYTTATGVSNLSGSTSVTLLQPALNVVKAAVPDGGDNLVEANELVTYTVDITNNGTAPAYDAVITDVIPLGMRNGAATVTMMSMTLLNANTSLTTIEPFYFANTGLVVWNLDSGVANTHSIPAAETLRLVYQVQVDNDIGTGVVLNNQAYVSLYHSFDNNEIPTVASDLGVREIYGPSNTASASVATASAGTLLKENPSDLSVTIGDVFSYQITVPEVPVNTVLYDVKILDDLTLSAADISFVSASKVSGSFDWTPVNSGSSTNLIIEDAVTGFDIPAGEQVVISVSVRVEDTVTNVNGLLFNNTASYAYNQIADDVTTQQISADFITPDMTIIEPVTLTTEKSGPTEMRIGIPGEFVLNIQNTGTATAWDITVTDNLPNLDPQAGGMCNLPPDNITAQIFEQDGVTEVSDVLVENVDYITNFLPAPDCQLSLTMESETASLNVNQRLIINYQASLDADTPSSSTLVNVAGVTKWFSNDTEGSIASGATRTYTEVLSDGTPGLLDHEDSINVAVDTPVILVQKRVLNLTTGQDPGSNAQPGDVLRYSIFIENQSDLVIDDFRFVDELDDLNAVSIFVAGSLNLITIPANADTSLTNAFGGAQGTGSVDIRNLQLGNVSSSTNQVMIEFEVTLKAAITNNTIGLNQGYITSVEFNLPTDDPNINGVDDPLISGDENATETLINSEAAFEVFKTSEDLTDDVDVLVSGDTLRYTITVKNIGTEDTINTVLRDQLPANTSYVENSTTLNGLIVNDLVAGELPLLSGIPINSLSNNTSGLMHADATESVTNIATVVFDVIIEDDLVNGTIISNQAFVTAEGAGSPALPEKASDDPATIAIDDPTLNVIGNQPLLDALKIVTIEVDNSTPGILDPGDVLRYTIIISNSGATAATKVSFVDLIPTNTTYVEDSVTLNGLPLGRPDGGVSPLDNPVDVSSSDLVSDTLLPLQPLPSTGEGVITAGESATISFSVQVDLDVPVGTVPVGTIISNQGLVQSLELPDELTDADGIDVNGDQPTLIAVGNAQLLRITKEVAVVGGGAALAGGELEYRIRVFNIGLVPAMTIRITDDLDLPVANQMTYVDNTGLINQLPAGVSNAAPVITADFGTEYGSLEPGENFEFKFNVLLNSNLAIGTNITNIAQVYWNSDLQSDSASVSIDIGGTPGVGNINGSLWHDANFNNQLDNNEQLLTGWDVEINRSGQLLGTVATDDNGQYQINGLLPNDVGTDRYELIFKAPGETITTAKLGLADSPAQYNYTDELQGISNIVLTSGSNVQNLNLPIDPNGVVYDSVVRAPIAGASISLLNAVTGLELGSDCFDDAAQQNQITLGNGYYKFDLNFTQADCVSGDDFIIRVTEPATDFNPAPSLVITPQTDSTTVALDVPNCSGSANDAILATVDYCEAQVSELAPDLNNAPGSVATNYYLKLKLDSTQLPNNSQLFNNHLPIDPVLTGAVNITKTSSLVNVIRSQLVPYTITVTNVLGVPLNDSVIIDNIPAGFKYVTGSARYNDVSLEPVQNQLRLSWENIDLPVNDTQKLQMLLVVGSAVNDGEYVNRAEVFDTLTNGSASGVAEATVRVVPDPSFDCSDIIGKVFDDKNLNAYQDDNEKGLAGVRVVTARGLAATTDLHGRYHLTCAAVPDESRGNNFIMKLDERTLPSGYRITTENPRVQRVTRGKILKYNFGATVHRIVSMDIANEVFVKHSDEIHGLWRPRLELLMQHLQAEPSILHLSYLADTESSSLVSDRLSQLVSEITRRWEKIKKSENKYKLIIETEIFWRRGSPSDRGAFD